MCLNTSGRDAQLLCRVSWSEIKGGIPVSTVITVWASWSVLFALPRRLQLAWYFAQPAKDLSNLRLSTD